MADDEGPSCRNCDKPLDWGVYCSRICQGMDRHPAPRRRRTVADDIVVRLAQEIDSLKADPQVLRDAIVELERLRVENAEQAQGWRAERALADQLADALGNEWPGISNKPYSDVSTAHAATTAALSAWQEARRG